MEQKLNFITSQNIKYRILCLSAIILLTFFSFWENAQAAIKLHAATAPHFEVIPLGTSGGELEDNLSAYLVAPADSNAWVALDAGTLCSRIKKIPPQTYKKLHIQSQPNKSSAEIFLTQNIKNYLISHAHLDHISGMVICSTIDSNKEIMGIDPTINNLTQYVFNWKIWPNFADAGVKPQLREYHYQRLQLGVKKSVPHTDLMVTPFLLNHGNGYPSTAFLLNANGYYLLYFGDTGADAIEHSQDINHIWQIIAPLIRVHKLSAIFIEASYPNQRPDKLLFGHLTPHWLLAELTELAIIVNPKQPQSSLSGLKVVVTHIKQGLNNTNMPMLILKQLREKNNLGVQFILPKPGQLMYF